MHLAQEKENSKTINALTKEHKCVFDTMKFFAAQVA
jgi:hypothetical protein